jgi:hypothetical protein
MPVWGYVDHFSSSVSKKKRGHCDQSFSVVVVAVVVYDGGDDDVVVAVIVEK